MERFEIIIWFVYSKRCQNECEPTKIQTEQKKQEDEKKLTENIIKMMEQHKAFPLWIANVNKNNKSERVFA